MIQKKNAAQTFVITGLCQTEPHKKPDIIHGNGDTIDKKHRTPRYTEEYPAKHPQIEIPILETDEVYYLSTNDKNNIRTNKRALDDHYATVLLGNLNVCDNKIILPKDVKAWSCKMYGGGIISSIGMKDTEVTVIIHL